VIINPLAQVLIYALILSNVLAAKLPGIEHAYGYALYLMAGVLAWTLFSEIVTRSLTLFVEQGNLMKKMYFPKSTLSMIVVGSSLLNNFFLFLSIIVVFSLLGQMPSIYMLWLIPLTIALVIIAMSLGIILGILNVFIRDIGQAVPVIIQVLFWFTPIVYPVQIVPERLQSLMIFNPFFHIVTAYHDVMVYAKHPDFQQLFSIFIIGLCLMALSLFIFRRASAEMVDVL
jgi:lipopolysaccharide transport system permease protein